jgi:MFS family permease
MSNSKQLAWCAWLIASIFYAYQYILRVLPNIMLTDIMQRFGSDAAIYGQFSGSYYIGYCLFHLPIGIMLDRYGPKKVMSICVLLTVIGLLPIIMSNHWVYPILGRALTGIGSSAAILGAFKIIRLTFEERHFTRMLSFTVTIGLLGAIYGGVPVSYFCAKFGYQIVIYSLIGIGLAFTAITYVLVPESNSNSQLTIISGIKTVLTNKKVLLVCFFAGLMAGPMEGFADAWGSEFLKQVYGLESTAANYMTSMIYIGMCFAPLLSRIAEKTGYYLGTITGAGFVMLAAFIVMTIGIMNNTTITISLFLVGICCAYQILAIYKASTYVPENVSGLATAIANMIIMSFGYLFHSIIGWIIKLYGASGNNIAFTYGISVIPAALLIGMAGFLFLTLGEERNSI